MRIKERVPIILDLFKRNKEEKITTHPGEFLLDEIEARGLQQNDLAIELDLPKSAINEIIKGKKALLQILL